MFNCSMYAVCLLPLSFKELCIYKYINVYIYTLYIYINTSLHMNEFDTIPDGKTKNDQTYSCPRDVSVFRHHGAQLKAPLKHLRPSQHYHIEGIKKNCPLYFMLMIYYYFFSIYFFSNQNNDLF